MTNVNVPFDPCTFQVRADWWRFMWGGGHTVETHPTLQGWRAKKIVTTTAPVEVTLTPPAAFPRTSSSGAPA